MPLDPLLLAGPLDPLLLPVVPLLLWVPLLLCVPLLLWVPLLLCVPLLLWVPLLLCPDPLLDDEPCPPSAPPVLFCEQAPNAAKPTSTGQAI